VFLQGLRHPSPLYQLLIDGLIVFVILWLYARKERPRLAVGAFYTLLYGCALLHRVLPHAGLGNHGAGHADHLRPGAVAADDRRRDCDAGVGLQGAPARPRPYPHFKA
jgi:hypothetical protein